MAETALLVRPRAVLVIIVEAGLADADDLGVSGQVDEPAGCVRRLAGRFVWMYADGAPDFVIRFSNGPDCRSEEHTSELQSLMRISYAVFCLKKKKITKE